MPCSWTCHLRRQRQIRNTQRKHVTRRLQEQQAVFATEPPLQPPAMDSINYLFLLKIDSSLTVHPSVPPHCTPPVPPPPPLASRSTLLPVSLQKRADLQGTTTKDEKKKYNKTRQKCSHQNWTRQPTGRKSPKDRRKGQKSTHSHC